MCVYILFIIYYYFLCPTRIRDVENFTLNDSKVMVLLMKIDSWMCYLFGKL